MAKSISDIAKRSRGRPKTTGLGTGILVRLQREPLEALDHWAARQSDDPSRPEAIRRLLEVSLKIKGNASPTQRSSQRLRAREMAAGAIDKLIDKAALSEEQASRKRRLLKGPEEFQEARIDRPKAKR